MAEQQILARSSGVCDDGDALLDDGGPALSLGQPELGAEEDVLPVGVEVHRQRDHGLLQGQNLNQSLTSKLTSRVIILLGDLEQFSPLR